MNEPTSLALTSYDLTREVPTRLTLTGLSQPQFDGVNYFRYPTRDHSDITFTVEQPNFVQLEYQLFSPTSTVTGTLKLDNQVIEQKIFPFRDFVGNSLSGNFIKSGQHRLSLYYTCHPACQTPPSQYWTKLSFVNKSIPEAIQAIGLNTVRLNQYTLQPLISLKGVGSLNFDGFNFFRPVEKNTIELDWPQGVQALNVNFQLLGNQPFKVTAKNNSEVLASATGNSKQDVFLHVNLIGKNVQNHLAVEINCLSKPSTTCTNLYFPSVVGQQESSAWPTSILLTIIIILLIVAALWYSLFPKYPRKLSLHRPTTLQQNVD